MGLSQRLTSQQALELLLKYADNCHVFFEENSFTSFHPKVYIFENELRGLVFLGSSNLTSGGLYTNHELDIRLDFDFSIATDKKDFQDFHELFDKYLGYGQSFCKKLDSELLDKLIAGNYISDEEADEKRERNEKVKPMRLFGTRRIVGSGMATSKVTAMHSPFPSFAYGFWKKLSKFDISKTSAPGQIIIPIRYLDLFPPMNGLSTQLSGGQQEEVIFDISFEEYGKTELVEGVRAIRYVPAPSHARPNIELRFTFHNREIFNKLSVDDVLEFRRSVYPKIWFVIKLIKTGSSEYAKYSDRRFDSI